MDNRLKLLEHQLSASRAFFSDLEEGKVKDRIEEEIRNLSFEIETIKHELRKTSCVFNLVNF